MRSHPASTMEVAYQSSILVSGTFLKKSSELLKLSQKKLLIRNYFTSASISSSRVRFPPPLPLVKNFNSQLANRTRFSPGPLSVEKSSNQTSDVENPEFDLNVAVLMAGFAFESYNTPETGAGVQLKDAGGCCATYLSQQFLEESFDGEMEVKVCSAKGCPPRDPWGTSDPFVEVQVGEALASTRTLWTANEPRWDEVIKLPVADPANQRLKIAVWDNNIVIKPRRMGVASVRLDGLCSGERHSVEVQLTEEGGGGTLLLEVQFRTHAQLAKRGWSNAPLEALAALLSGALPSFMKPQILQALSPRSNAQLQATASEATTSAATSPASSDSVTAADGDGDAMPPGTPSGDFGVLNFAWQALQRSGWGQNGSDVSESLPDANPQEDGLGESSSQQKVEEQLESLGRQVASQVSEEERERMRQLFGSTESAVQAWALLATSLKQPDFVQSHFDKLCFVENPASDTQAAVWRDVRQRRVVVAFRGTEQTKVKDLVTDLSLAPAGFDPERTSSGDFKEDIMIHGGFLRAYDSVRRRLVGMVCAICTPRVGQGGAHSGDGPWQVYVTGHSLGGALATLLALELQSSRAARSGHLKVAMYNFGSPRVGNRCFALRYNEVVKDSWRIVNHRDIIPTMPRLLGYCHVNYPVHLTAEPPVEEGAAELGRELAELDGKSRTLLEELTPDGILERILRGEQQVVQSLVEAEVAVLASLRDGTALMMHMEDFYYMALLKRVETKADAPTSVKLSSKKQQ